MTQINLGGWANNLGKKEKMETDLARKVREVSDQYVPFLHGNLANVNNTQIIHDDTGAHLIYNEPYAHRQFVGVSEKGNIFNYTKTFHPYAGSDWIGKAKQENMEAFSQFVRGEILG